MIPSDKHLHQMQALGAALVGLAIVFECMAGFAVYKRATSNTQRIELLEQAVVPAHAGRLDSVAWQLKPAENEQITNTYKPLADEGDTLEFCHKVIANIDMWREATRK